MNIEEFLAPQQYNMIDDIEKHNSDKIALQFISETLEKEEFSYRQLIENGNKLANGLAQLGFVKGDHLLVMVPRSFEAYVIYFACLKSGIVLIPASEMLRANDILFRLNNGEIKGIIAHKDFCEEIDKISNKAQYLQHKLIIHGKAKGWIQLSTITENQSTKFVKAATTKDDIAIISYTSGTTGQPKGVVHVHGWGYAHLRLAAKKWLNIRENDLVWATAAPGWQKWVWSPFLSILGSGATGFIYKGKFSPKTYLRLLDSEKINVLCCTPTEYRLMAKVEELNKYDLSKLHSAVSAGEALNREVIDVFQNYFHLEVRDGYGQTESTLLIGTVKGMKGKPGSMGSPLFPEFIEIVDENGIPVEVGKEGNIAVRQDFPALFKQYFHDSERTAKAFANNYFITGDRAYKDVDNYFWYLGRNDDMIISSGYTIGPFEVEDALMKHHTVKECAVVASPDPIRGNIVKAFVVLKTKPENELELVRELQSHVKLLTAPYKYPREIEFVKSLPKTDSGKIRRVELRTL